MLKKLILLLSIFTIASNVNAAAAESSTTGMNYITQATQQDLDKAGLNAPSDLSLLFGNEDKEDCNTNCTICNESICREFGSDISDLYKVNCPQKDTHPHVFHKDCILRWVNSYQEQAHNCPICRGKINEPDELLNKKLIQLCHRAYRGSNLEAIITLLNQGANVNARCDVNGDTPLMIACKNENLDLVKLLLIYRGVDVNATNKYGQTAYIKTRMDSWKKGPDEMTIGHLLIDKGADINIRDRFGKNARDYASPIKDPFFN